MDRPYWNVEFRDGDFLLFGRESKGLPSSLLEAHPQSSVTIPMTDGTRSINLSTSTGIVLYEAIRQLNVSSGQLPLVANPVS